MKKNKMITIIGGGPAGMGIAYYCNENKISYELYELNSIVGGNCRTFNINGFRFDSGAHRFHDKDKKSTKIIKKLMKNDLKLINVPSQIYINGKFINFPLSPIDLINFLGFSKFILETIKLFFIKVKNKKIKNFKDFAINKYGYKISNLFLLNYSKKLWGLPPTELSIKIAGKRINGINIRTFLLELLNVKKKNHLDGIFYYPAYGIGTIFNKMKNYCGDENFHLNSKVSSILHENKKITSVIINNKKQINIKHLISSLSLDVLIKLLSPSPPKKILKISKSIKYRNLILVIFLLNKSSINNNGSMYFPSDEFIFTRIYEPKNRSGKMSPINKTSLIVEIPCMDNDKIWNSNKKNLINEIKQQLININFFKEYQILENNIKKISKAYPVLESDYIQKLNPIKEYLSKFENLYINGRNGNFEYTHIHDHLKESNLIISTIKSHLNNY